MNKNLRIIKMDVNDNVGTALQNIKSGEIVDIIDKENKRLNSIKVINEIYLGYKVSLDDINIKDNVIKYGYNIGKAYKNIQKGELVHIHNIKSNRIEIPDYRREAMMNEMEIYKT